MKTPDADNEIVFLGKMAEDLSTLIEKQTKPVHLDREIVIPVKSCSIIVFLSNCESASASDIAKGLKQSHQLILQKIPALTKLKLISCRNDPKDLRKKQYRITSKGRKQAQRLASLLSQVADVYREIFKETGVDLVSSIRSVTSALEETSIRSRLKT